jgi:putative phosphoesterase
VFDNGKHILLKTRSIARIIAVVADTHQPDRVGGLHPRLISMLKDLSPWIILHAGDISQPSVLKELSGVAPIKAVRGNRDWKWLLQLPMEEKLEINGARLILLHGHGNWGHYFADKMDHTLRSYRLARYEKYLTKRFPDADGYVFGHSHFPENTRVRGKLFFNPGSACLGGRRDILPSFGVMRIDADGGLEAEIIPLNGFKIVDQEWVSV